MLQTTTSIPTAVVDGFYRPPSPSDLTGLSGHSVVFSYAPPDMVRQAKLEAMEIKVRRKMLERRASLLDTHALSDLSVAAAAAAAAAAATIRVSARANADAVGSPDLVKSLVVPPQITEHGEEVRGSSEFIVDGERLEYQRPGLVAPDASQAARPMPRYRTYEANGKRPSVLAGLRKKPWGITEAAGAAESADHHNGSGGGGLYGQAKASQGKAWGKELKAQLSDGMMSYVPSKFERPKNVERTAFVPQGQAMEDARNKYESVKQRRPFSAPQRRAVGTVGAAAADADGGGRMRAGSSGSALVGNGGAAVAGGRLFAGSVYRDRKSLEVTMVRVEETDLYAMYRMKSQQQQLSAGGPRDCPTKGRGIDTSTASTSGARHSSAAQPAQAAAGGGISRQSAPTSRGPAGTLSMPNSRKNVAATGKAPAAAPTAAAPRQADSAARVRQRPASATPAAGAAAAKAAGAPRGKAFTPIKASIAPATGVEAAALASGSTRRPWTSRPNSSKLISSVWDAPRSLSPSKTPSGSRAPSQRHLSAPTGPGAGPAVADNGNAAAAAGDSGADSRAGAGPRICLQPLDPETRRQRQNRPGSAINTAKTNRLRAPAGGLGGAPYGTPAMDYGGGPAWTTSSATAPPPCDRTQLQERILGGLVRQYTFGDDDTSDSPNATSPPAAAAETAGAVLYPPRRPARPRVTSDAVAPAGGGLLAAYGEQQQSYQRQQSQQGHVVGRPQSAPNRRLRPPSPGHWAGRPEPEAVLSRAAALQHTTTGIVYDPDLQPSPLDTYVNQLNGLD